MKRNVRFFALISALLTLFCVISCDNVSDDTEAGTTYYTVSFDSEGGSAVTVQTVESGKLAIEPKEPTKTGYTFAGWYKDGAQFDFSKPITANITLIAHWTAKNDNSNNSNNNNDNESNGEEQTQTNDIIELSNITFEGITDVTSVAASPAASECLTLGSDNTTYVKFANTQAFGARSMYLLSAFEKVPASGAYTIEFDAALCGRHWRGNYCCRYA